MPQPTTVPPRLLSAFHALVDAHRAALGQERCFQRFTVLVLGLLCALGRHSLTQVLVSLGLGELDWSAAYRLFSCARIDYAALVRCFLRETLACVTPEQPYLVVVDGVQLPHQSRRLPGTSWLHNPTSPAFQRGIHRAQRFSDLAWLTPPTETGKSRALPARVLPALQAKAERPAGLPAQKEWEAGLEQFTWLRTEVDAAGRGRNRNFSHLGGDPDHLDRNPGVAPTLGGRAARCPPHLSHFARPQPCCTGHDHLANRVNVSKSTGGRGTAGTMRYACA